MYVYIGNFTKIIKLQGQHKLLQRN